MRHCNEVIIVADTITSLENPFHWNLDIVFYAL